MNFKKTVTIAAAAGALCAFALPALAETTLYGSARVQNFWKTTENKAVNPSDTNTDFDMHLASTSRLGLIFTSGDVTGMIEYGAAAGNANIRLLYGTYKFNFGTLLVGQNYNGYYVGSAQVAPIAADDNVNINYGALWDQRQAQIKLTLNNGVYLAAIQSTVPVTATSELLIPKLNVGYEGKADNITFGGGIVGQTYKDQSIKKTITSLMGYAHGTLQAGPAALLVNLGVGQNTGNMGLTSGNATGATAGPAATYIGATNVYANSKDTISIEGMVQGSYTVSPVVKVNAIFGYAQDDNSGFKKVDNRMSVTVNAPVTLAKNVTIIPEFDYIDQLDQKGGTKGNKDYIYGAQMRINF